jgi:hypothetical protein
MEKYFVSTGGENMAKERYDANEHLKDFADVHTAIAPRS